MENYLAPCEFNMILIYSQIRISCFHCTAYVKTTYNNPMQGKMLFSYKSGFECERPHEKKKASSQSDEETFFLSP